MTTIFLDFLRGFWQVTVACILMVELVIVVFHLFGLELANDSVFLGE